MAKLSLAEKLAKKSFESEMIQKSWQVHSQMFGPILEPAFVESYQARVHLTAALNMISGHDLRGGLDKLKSLEKYVQNDGDRAAWLFFMGLVFEMAGVKDAMLDFYQQAAEVGHRFYLPYLKVAKAAHNDNVFEVAEKNYRTALDCLAETGAGAQTAAVNAAICTNLAGCLTMMHRYDEADAALDASRQHLPQQPGRCATQAILCAAMGRHEEVQPLLTITETEAPGAAAATRETVEKILAGQHPHFTALPVDEAKLDAFWAWFADNEEIIRAQLDAQQYNDLFPPLQEQLALVFPFAERPLELAFRPLDDGNYGLTFADFYMIALSEGYARLLDACPAALRQRWPGEIVH